MEEEGKILVVEVTVIRSNRKTIALQVNPDLTVTVRAPKRMADREIRLFVQEKEHWIRRHVEQLRQRTEQYDKQGLKPLSYAELNELADKALAYIPERVAHFAEKMGITYGRITIRNQKTRWGSCSSKGNLNFNCLLMLTPPEVIDYVVIHELCHRKEMNHSKAFWDEVSHVMPDYEKARAWLKSEGDMIMRRALKNE